LIVDISGNRDLDLNSSRPEIIFSEKWTDFAQELASVICAGIVIGVSLKYWNALKNISLKNSTNEVFLQGRRKVRHGKGGQAIILGVEAMPKSFR
jgi:hypothetical protein